MTYKNLLTVIEEAQRLLKKAEELKGQNTTEWGLPAGPCASAVRRSSMDLTRALARLRKP